MPITTSTCVAAIEQQLSGKGFDLSKSPNTKDFIEIIVEAVLAEIKKGTVQVTVTGTSATGGPVTGSGVGNIS